LRTEGRVRVGRNEGRVNEAKGIVKGIRLGVEMQSLGAR